MTNTIKKIIVTGGAGFIGSAVCRRLIDNGFAVLNVDKLTYAADLSNLKSIEDNPSYTFLKADICDGAAMAAAFASFKPDAIMNLAAESHVDRSIEDSAEFIQTNVAGTVSMLEAARRYWENGGRPEHFRFHHISTDEVYGDLSNDDPAFTEETPYSPSSPYSASKAASDHMVRAWHRTYKLPILVSNCSNNYGPGQFPEKLIPLMIVNALTSKGLPVYGEGKNIRDWLYVEDHAEALETILLNGQVGETYNVGGDHELMNIDVVTTICHQLDTLKPRQDGKSYVEQIEYVTDRIGHDRRYAVDFSKVKDQLGWTPRHTFDQGLAKTIEWMVERHQI